MSSIHQQLLERNARETTPFVPVYEAYSYLQQQVDALQNKLDDSDQEVAALRQQVHDRCDTSTNNKGPLQKSKSNIAMQSALKNETRLRDKLELLQEEYNTKLKVESDVQADALKTAKRLLEVQALCDSNEKTIVSLKQQVDRGIDAVDRLQLQVQDAESRTLLAEQQYDGLKTTVRSLQEENDALSKENRMFEGRIVSDKEKEADEMNKLTEMIEKLQNEVVMLRTLKQHEDQRKSTSSSTKSSWFGGSSHKDSVANAIAGSTTLLTKDETTPTRKFGDFGVVVVPTTPKQTIATAHAMEITFVKYEASGSSSNLLVTGSSDSTVKLWDSTNGSLRSTFRGSPGHSIMCGDFSGNVVVGGGSDKTCRVWNIRTERMIHHLVGHQHKITCVRLFADHKKVISGSADRSMKVWDIHSKTYRQTLTLRHSSTSTCLDVSSDGMNVVSGHMDGGLRFWDLQSGERSADFSGIHEGGVTSVQFNPTGNAQVLTNSLDSTLKIVDVRSGTAAMAFCHPEFKSLQGWSRAVYSPDGRYVASGSNLSGVVFIWDVSANKLQSKLTDSHNSGVVGIDWCSGNNGGQQVATVDRKGSLILWA